jgi:hypothetical protein
VRNYLDPNTEAKITGVVERELIADQVGDVSVGSHQHPGCQSRHPWLRARVVGTGARLNLLATFATSLSLLYADVCPGGHGEQWIDSTAAR